MRNNYDTLVIGAGFSGLIASLCAAQKGKKVGILAKGAGSLTIGGGVIDVLGYVDGQKTPVKKPFEAIEKLHDNHPYKLLGIELLKESLNFFKEFTSNIGYPYESNGDDNSWLPTAIGTLKPTYLKPSSKNQNYFQDKDTIYIAGVKGLKDFYPALTIKGLKAQKLFKDKNFISVMLENPYTDGRDINALDMARVSDTPVGFDTLVKDITEKVPGGSVVITPPLFGTQPSLKLTEKLKNDHNIECFEISMMPPSVTGLRLRQLLLSELRKYDTEIIEMAEAYRAEVTNNRCNAVLTKNDDKERRYTAKDIIVATGGFLGGGCIAKVGSAHEMVFNIDLNAPSQQEEWSKPSLFNDQHLFASMGVKVNGDLKAVDQNGNEILKNVRFIGRTLGGYDYCVEKSGNGVALVTAYYAGRA